jgi:hypothetical protein
MSEYYILGGKGGHQVIPVKDVENWARMYEENEKHKKVDYDEIITTGFDHKNHEYTVSTVFLGINHRFGGGGPPIVFETMVFHGIGKTCDFSEILCWRYCTWNQAVKGHKKAVQWAKLLPDILIVEEIMQS